MKKILCIHEGKSYLPEIDAYKKYFAAYGDFQFIDSIKDLNGIYEVGDFDILWYIMGTDFKAVNMPKVHDYASLSTGNMQTVKNLAKRVFNKTPNLRLFLNDHVKNTMNFTDSVPYLIRDMGVDKSFFIKSVKKEYDFVYMGAITEERKIPQLLYKFKSDLKSKSILVIGEVPLHIYKEFSSSSNIIFSGKLTYKDVPRLASKAIYGINMVPDQSPFNSQTSTKLLEYCALGLKVITTQYQWQKEFENRNSAHFFKIDEKLEKFDLNAIENFKFKTPGVEDLEWSNILDSLELNTKLLTVIEQGYDYG